MPTTYEPIATTTLSSAAANITFSSIGAGYTDLRLICHYFCDTISNPRIQLNGDTGTNYSRSFISGGGSGPNGGGGINQGQISLIGVDNVSNTYPTLLTIDFFSYAGSTNKSILANTFSDKIGLGEAVVNIGLWRNTSAITSIRLFPSAGNIAAGTTATLYGILKA